VEHLRKFVKKLRHLLFGTYARGFISTYLLVMLIGTMLLKLPLSVQPGVDFAWIDAMFTAASALSVTGLTTIVVRDTFTIFGQTVLILIIQFGGIGLIMMIAMFWLVVRKRIGFKQRNMIMTDQNQLSRKGIVRFIRNVIIMIFFIEGVAFLMIGTYLFMAGYFPIDEAFFQAFFLTISLFTNAGFDIAPNNDSYMMFANDYFMQSIGMGLIFLGAVGFWVLAELKEWTLAKFSKKKYEFSLYVNIVVIMYLLLWIGGAIGIYMLEYDKFLSDKSIIEGIFYAMFMSITTRNAGFSTMDVNDFSSTTQVLLMGLMFIGASPNSVGGGIRTTTFLVIILSILSFARGHSDVLIKGRKIKDETIHKSFVTMIASASLVLFVLFLVSFFEPHSTSVLAFEVTSAFGTTGLSLGVTEELGSFSKLVISLLMFIGRMGVLALLLIFRPKEKKRGLVQYPETDIIVG